MKRYFFLLSLSDGRGHGQIDGTVDVKPGAKLQAIYGDIRKECLRRNTHLSPDAAATIWVFQPNELGV